MDKLVSIETDTIRTNIAHRLRRRRLDAGWTQSELSDRSGVPLGTLKRFESTGNISLDTLLRLARPLGGLPDFDTLFPAPVYSSIDDVIRATSTPTRKRGKRRG